MKGTIAILFVVISSAYSQVVGLGKCPQVQAVKNFNESKYLGKWYESAKYFNIYEVNTVCGEVSYALESNGSVQVTGNSLNASSGLKHTSIGTGNFAKNGLGEFEVYVINTNLDTKYIILGTDYTSYSAVISCVQLSSNYHETYAWLFTRSRNASMEIIETAVKVFEAQKIDNIPFMVMNIGCQ